MNRRIFAFIATLVLLFPLLAACGNTGTTGNNGGQTATTSTGTGGASSASPTSAASGGQTPSVGMTTTSGPAPSGTQLAVPGATGTTSAGAQSAGCPPVQNVTPPAISTSGTSGGKDKTITIASKNFTEEKILGEMYAQALEANGYKVNRKLNLGDTALVDKALQNKEIDMYPDYTGTLAANIVGCKRPQNIPSSEKTYQIVKNFYLQRDPSDTLLKPAPYENTNAIVVTQEAAKKYNLKTYEDLAKAAPNLTFASFSEFQHRSDSFPLLQNNYPGVEKMKILLVNNIGAQRYLALQQGKADVTIGFTTDPQIQQYNLVVLKDPKHIWPYYYEVPIINSQYLKAHPDVAPIINKVSSLLTADIMRKLNGKVAIQHEDEADVARDFLKQHGIVK